MSKPLAYIDVDLTLVDVDLNLYEGVIDRLKELAHKYTLVCWSAGGADYATYVLKKVGIHDYFAVVMDKPYIIIDDEPQSILDRASKVRIMRQSDWDKNTFWGNLFHKPVDELCTSKNKSKNT